MNETLKTELTAWLDFYRELGLDPFYRRPPGSRPKPWQAVPPVPAELAGQPQAQGALPQVQADSRSRPPAIAIPARTRSLFEPASERRTSETLDDIRRDLGDCQRCRLAQGRKTIVFGEGNPRAEVIFIGEGPGANEDDQGRPFVGRAGQLLNKMLALSGLRREDVYIANVVKCRPPGNRTPDEGEVDTCSPFLFRQIEAIRPRLVVCLGAPAVRTVLGLREGITKIRGRFYDFGSAKALATLHPAYILRNPREEKMLREDFDKIRAFLHSADH